MQRILFEAVPGVHPAKAQWALPAALDSRSHAQLFHRA